MYFIAGTPKLQHILFLIITAHYIVLAFKTQFTPPRMRYRERKPVDSL